MHGDTTHEIEVLERHFAKMGARLKVYVRSSRSRWLRRYSIDIGRDRRGQFFHFVLDGHARIELQALEVKPRKRHLLLLVKERSDEGAAIKDRFLCGHDERSWFVASVPDVPGIVGVASALEALKPRSVVESQDRKHLPARRRQSRRNPAFVRQGEWFFVPCLDLEINETLVLRHEPLARGGGTPHMAERLFRRGGELVYIADGSREVLTQSAYRELLSRRPEARRWTWRTRRRNPEVYVSGRITHPDHATVVLACWHRVEPNTEARSRAAANLDFID
jgi:hypothetical protein